MPYTVEDAPEAVQKLPRHARDIWLAAFNAVSAEYQEQEDGEARAFATAWAAVKRDYEQDEAGMWHRKSKQIAGLLPSKTADHPCAMIAFFLPLASARWLAMPGGEKAEDLHLTLAALGPVDALPLSEQRETVRGVVAEFAAGRPSLPAKLTGFGRFQTDGEPDALYLNVDAPELPAFSPEDELGSFADLADPALAMGSAVGDGLAGPRERRAPGDLSQRRQSFERLDFYPAPVAMHTGVEPPTVFAGVAGLVLGSPEFQRR